MMFTLGATGLTLLILFAVNRGNVQDRPRYRAAVSDTVAGPLLLHIRQDLKLIAFLLAGILIALGVVADRVGS